MEDLWKDITLSTLSSLHHPSPATPTTTHLYQTTPHHYHHIPLNLTTTTFQDFLARPFSLDNHHHTTPTVPIKSTTSNNNSQPQSILSIHNTDNIPPDFHLGDSSSGQSPPTYNPFDYTCSSAHQFKRRLFLESECDEMNLKPVDRRHTRMIKNRESAARSRARKQAYTTELELQVAKLKKENAGLRMKMEDEMHIQAALDQTPKKHKLHRTTTAPF